MKILETERLTLRWLALEDAPFIFELLNEPSWIQFIGDKNIKTLADAQNYIQQGPLEMYHRLGFGLYLVELKSNMASIGLCGLIKRDGLENVDIGFGFLPQFWGKGYAFESATAVLTYGKNTLGIAPIVAITDQKNYSSIKLLERLGFHFERLIQLTPDDDEINLFVYTA